MIVRRAETARLAITLGDPRGIGAEVTAKALAQFKAKHDAEIMVIGPHVPAVAEYADHCVTVGHWTGGSPAEAGKVAGKAIEKAVEMALLGTVDAIITAPIDKQAFAAAGYDYPGHTEMLAALAGQVPVAMMMCAEPTRLGGPLRVVLATIHLPLSRVPSTLTTALLVEQAGITVDALRRDWGIAEPRIALCALNPHASDGGLFGDEEARIMAPAREQLQAEGIQASGPFPADTVFVRAINGEFDAVIAPYHDVGMAAFKTASFGQGVNVTLGLPFPRTSPDHGTAIDIAGRGIADPSSMLEALELALRLALKRKSITAVR